MYKHNFVVIFFPNVHDAYLCISFFVDCMQLFVLTYDYV